MFDLDSYLQARYVRHDRKYETHGEWWLPNKPERCFGGQLRWRPDSGATVFCGGSLLSYSAWPMADDAVIHGRTAGGCPVSLVWPLSYEEGTNPDGQSIKAWGLLVGGNIESIDAKSIETLYLDISNLTEWITEPPFKVDYTKADGDPPTSQRTTYLVDMDAPHCGPVPSIGATCTISAGHSQCGGHGYKVTHVATRQLVFHFDSLVSLRELISLSWKLELLLTLLTGSPSISETMLLLPPNASFREEKAFLRTRTRKPIKRTYARQLMPVRFENLEGRFATILDAWLNLNDRIAPVLNLLAVALFREDDRFFEDRFLGVAQAAEGYCRILWPDTYADKDAFAGVLPEMLAVIDQLKSPTLSSKAKTSLVYQNEFSLRDRLLKLFEREPWLIPILGKGADDAAVKSFVATIVKNRNDLTHVDAVKSKTRKPIDDRVTRKLRAVLCASILHKIGVEPSLYDDAIRKETHDFWW